MRSAVFDAVAGVTLGAIERLKLSAELVGLVKKKGGLGAGPLASLQGAKIAAQILVVLGKMGVDLKARDREAQAFELEGGPEPVAQPRKVMSKSYDFDPNRKTSQRRKDNSQAVELLRQIDRGDVDGSALTDTQKAVLARYSGTGGNLVNADTGKKGSAYEYYTPKPIAEGIHGLLAELGFTGGKMLDPCAGSGIFGATAPANVAVESVELNEVSGRVNQLVNGGPGYNAIISPFEAVAARTPDETYDAVITNVPFGSVHDRGANRMLDDRYQDQSLETYFILRSLEKLKPGGLAAFIVPPRVVSGKGGRNEQLRIAASYSAEFLGAYRLPNSVFGAADADTITDVIVFRKFGRQVLDKIAELKEQNPATLVAAKVQWTEFIAGDYFREEGRRFVLGEFVAKDPSKFRDVDRVVNTGSVADIAKLLRKFPGSRVDWAMLNATETQPIIYNDGDTMTLAGQTLEMRDGVWVAIGKPQESSRYDGMGQALSNAAAAVANKVDWATAKAYVEYLRNSSMELDMPDWLRLAHRDVGALDVADQPKYWAALSAGLAVVEVTRAHSDEPGFNYSQEYPAVHEALATVAATAKKAPGAFSATAKQALVKVGIVYDRKQGYSALWLGQVGDGVLADKVLGTDAQVEAIKYRTKGITIPVEDLKAVYGEDFDPLTDEAWCVNADGTNATKADDYFTGNLGTFLERIDAEIAQAQGPLRDKLLRQKAAARERVSVLEPNDLRFNLFSPFVSMEEKAEFLRRFVHPAFVVGHNDDGEKVILCDIASPKNERERQLKRFAEYLKRGNLSTRTTESEAKSNPQLEESRRKMLRGMAATANAQFDQWTKANPAIMDRMRQAANDPARVYFNEVDDNSAVPIEGMGDGIKLHGYQNAFVRKMARSFSGINGFDVGLGKTFTALASVQYVQSIGVKKKTIFVVPNSVLSNWRREAGRAYANLNDCLFVGLDIGEDGKSKVDSGNYARDFNKVLENRHAKIFCTLEAFKTIPLKDETVAAYGAHLSRVDPSYAGGDRTAETERAESKLAEATSGVGTKSSAIPFFEDMGIDSIVLDEAHMFKNSKQTVEFSGAKFLSVADASQRGLDIQMKAWFVRNGSPLHDGVLALTATPITNSPLEIYSMLCLAVGEEKVHDLTMGARGADEFMEVMCDIEDDEEATIDGRIRPYRVFRGLQNVTLLRQAIGTVATIKNGNDVKADGDDLKLPDAPENAASVQLTPQAGTLLNAYKIAYRAARYTTGAASKDQEPPTEDELKIMNMVAEKFGEPLELIAHPFNLINKMTMVIADPELDERATFYAINPAQAALAAECVDKFNALKKIEVRRLPGPWTESAAVVGTKTVKDGEAELVMYRIRVEAKVDSGRVVVDTLDTNNQGAFEAIAEKAGLELDCSIPPKYAALLENVRKEEAHPRSASGRVKQLIFCDILPSHNKLRRLLIKHCGFTASAVAIISGQAIKNPEQMQGIQDGFNAEGEENKYRIVIANEKAEVGINLQKGTQAIHHLTIGWTPDSQVQRNGRGVRQGNTTASVNIYHYDANGTFDTYKRNLTSRKADWIGAVMDRQGGNEVQVAGGLTNDQYDELIEAMGNEGAVEAIRQRAEMKERAARAASARSRQVINIQTAAAQDAFLKRNPTAKSWIADQALKLYDMVKALDVMDAKLAKGMNAASTMKMEARRAELQATINGLAARIDASLQINAPYGYKGQRLATGVPILGLVNQDSHYKVAAKVREDFVSRLNQYSTVQDGSEMDQEWQAETAASEAMKAEALRDFERIAKQSGDAYPAELVAAYRDGNATIIDGQPVARGMFVRAKDGTLMGVVISTVSALTHPGGREVYLSDIAPQGGKFVMFGTPDYDQALNEAAAFEDEAVSVSPSQRLKLYSTIVPAVAQRRKRALLVNYSPRSIKLPSPFFAYPIDPSDTRLSEPVRAIGASQTVIKSWVDGEVMIDSTVDVELISGYSDQGKARMAALADRIRADGKPIPLSDYAVFAFNSSSDYYLSDARRALMRYAIWPADATDQIAAAASLDDLEAICQAMASKAYSAMVTGMEDAGFDRSARSDISDAYYRRKVDLKRAADLAAMEADLAARKAEAERLAAERAATGEQVAPVAPEPAAVDVNRSTMKLSPWVSPKTGEKRVYFNGLPGATKAENIYANDSGTGKVRFVAPYEMAPGRRDEFIAMAEKELAIMNGGTYVQSFADLLELAGVKPIDTSVPSVTGLDPNAIIGITGRTKENIALIKSAAMRAGGRATWMGQRLQWNVPAAAWDIIIKEKPEAAQELQTVAP
jgi:predicted RNA methylase